MLSYNFIEVNNEMTEFNWDDSAVLLLIEKYQENEPLWNPRHMDFKNRNKRNDAIRDIASVFNIASSEIERKLKNLSSHYFRVNANMKNLKGVDLDGKMFNCRNGLLIRRYHFLVTRMHRYRL